jgi:hypothetical protein
VGESSRSATVGLAGSAFPPFGLRSGVVFVTVATVVAALATAVALHVVAGAPNGAGRPSSTEPAAIERGSEVRLIAMNLWQPGLFARRDEDQKTIRGIVADDRTALDSWSRNYLAHADIAFLSEVREAPHLAYLARTSGLRHAASTRTEPDFGDGRRPDSAIDFVDVAILSRWPLTRVGELNASGSKALAADVVIGAVAYRVFAAHLHPDGPSSHAPDRMRVVRWMLALAAAHRGPVLIGGDMNAGIDAPEMIALRDAFHDASVPPERRPTQDLPLSRSCHDPMIDFIVFRGSFRVAEHDRCDRAELGRNAPTESPHFSDHPFPRATLVAVGTGWTYQTTVHVAPE